MNRPGAMAAGALLSVFGGLVIFVQLFAYSQKPSAANAVVRSYAAGSVLGAFRQASLLAQTTNIVERGGGTARLLDLVLPPNDRLYLTGVAGTNTGPELAQYYYLTYYLFPREIAVTLDPPRFTVDGVQGRPATSDEEMKANGFDARLDLLPDGKLTVKEWRGTDQDLANPPWFDSWSDAIKAFLLPFFTAAAGVWLLRLLFGENTVKEMAMGEKLAAGLGVGMMTVAALTLGIKLAGFHGHGWVFALVIAGGVFELYRDRNIFRDGLRSGFKKMAKAPLAAILFIVGAAVFLILFRLAAVQGIAEFDGVANWLFKAKILFVSTGHEIFGYFSNPRLAYAHLDYPALVPSLHAATFDSLGHVDEFVTKFWPVWMLLFLLLALSSLGRGQPRGFPAPLFFLLGVLLLPFTQIYVEMEGATVPMIFFTVLGLLETALGLAEQNRPRLGLGLTLLFGAALTKFEGAIFLALATTGILFLSTARPLLKPSPRCWRILAFGILAALPFLCLRAQIPVLHYESGWVGYALADPGTTLANTPKIFLILLGRLFLAPALAKWSATGGQIHWTGHWTGASSFYDHMTLGLPWVSLVMTILLWFSAPTRRPVILWTLVVFFSAVLGISVVFASFVNLGGLNDVVSARASDNEAGRYLFPLLLAWAAVMVTLFFRSLPRPETGSNDPATPPLPLPERA